MRRSWLAGLCVLAGGVGCSSSTQPSEPPLEGITGAWVGVAPVFAPTDSLGLFITDSAGTFWVFGRFNSGLYQQYSFGIFPSSDGLKTRLGTYSPPFFATLDLQLSGSSLVGTYNDSAVTLTRMHPPSVATGLWVETAVTGPNDPAIVRFDSIWVHRDGRIHRKLVVRYGGDSDCINNGQGISKDRSGAVVLIYLSSISEDGCRLPDRDSLIIQGSTLRRRTLTFFGVIEEIFQHRAQ